MIRWECARCSHISQETNQTAHFIARSLDFISIKHNPIYTCSVPCRNGCNRLEEIIAHSTSLEKFYSQKKKTSYLSSTVIS